MTKLSCSTAEKHPYITVPPSLNLNRKSLSCLHQNTQGFPRTLAEAFQIGSLIFQKGRLIFFLFPKSLNFFPFLD